MARFIARHDGIPKAEAEKRARLRAELAALTKSPLRPAEREAIAARVRRGKTSQTFFRRGAALMGDG